MIGRDDIQKLFGKIVRKERKKQRITQSELAEKSKLDNTYISQIERGLANPSIYTLHKISTSLDIPEYEIFKRITAAGDSESESLLKPVDELEIIYDAILKLDASLLLTTTHDDDFRVIFCNEAFLKLSNLKRVDIVGKKLLDILAYEESNNELINFLSQLKEKHNQTIIFTDLMSSGKPMRLEVKALTVKGDSKSTEKHAFLLKESFDQVEDTNKKGFSADQYKILLNEANHRIKNQLSAIAGIIDINKLDVDDEQVKIKLKDIQLRISSIAHIHDLLANYYNHTELGIQDYLSKIVTVNSNTFSYKTDVDLEVNIGAKDLGIDKLIAIGLLSNELITNSYKYAFNGRNGDGAIKLNLSKNGSKVLNFTYEDNGIGFDIEKFEQGKTLGFSLIHAFLEQLDAKNVQVDTEDGFRLGFSFDADVRN